MMRSVLRGCSSRQARSLFALADTRMEVRFLVKLWNHAFAIAILVRGRRPLAPVRPLGFWECQAGTGLRGLVFQRQQ